MQALNTDESQLINDFKSKIQAIADVFNQSGVKVTPFHDSQLPDFATLTTEKKREACLQAQQYLATLDAVEAGGWALTDEKRALWAALKFFNLRPTSDIFEYVTAQDAVEVYSLEGIQLWRNYAFMEVCSYTLEEIFCYSWHDRYLRNDEAATRVGLSLQKMVVENVNSTMYFGIKNVLTETFSQGRYIIDVEHRHVSPVRSDDHKIVGFIAISSVKLMVSKETSSYVDADRIN